MLVSKRPIFEAIGNDPLHRLFSLFQLSSYVPYNLRRPQDPSQSLLPTKETPANSSSPEFAGFVTNCQGSLCSMPDEEESCKPPMASRYWDVRHHKNRLGQGVRTCTPLGTRRPLVCQTPLVILYWHMSGKQAQHILYTWHLMSRLFLFLSF